MRDGSDRRAGAGLICFLWLWLCGRLEHRSGVGLARYDECDEGIASRRNHFGAAWYAGKK